MLEHGAYTLLIDSCYDRERFPTRDDAIEWTWARSDAEIAAVDFVLSKFFDLENGVYVQNRIKEEIEKYHANSEINKRIAQDREEKRRTNRERTVNEPPPNQEPRTTNQEPLTKNQTTSAPQAAFVLPAWIDKEQWDLWLKTRKGKKMIPEQMDAQVKKLAKWRAQGLDYNKALSDSAASGWQGLFEPKQNVTRPNSVQEARLETARQIFGGRNGTNRQTIDITPERTVEDNGENIPKTFLGLRESDVS